MRIAVSEYQGRIAPVFDTCRRVIIFLHTPQGDSELASEDWSALPRYNRPDRLVKLSVQTVLCGGIGCRARTFRAARGNVASRARCRVRKGDNRCRDTMELDH